MISEYFQNNVQPLAIELKRYRTTNDKVENYKGHFACL